MDWKQTLQADPVMAELIRRHGPIQHEPADDEFERLCISIINQQLSTASASAIRERVFEQLGGIVSPDTILISDREELREAGLSRTKIDYLTNVAQAFREENLTRGGLSGHSDEEVIEELTAIKGVGEWTARMYLMFALGREDVLPLGDLGIRNGFQQIYADESDLSRAEMREIAEEWRPYRTYGVRYIWKEYEANE